VSLQKVRKGEQVLFESKFLPKLILRFASVVFSSWTKTFDLLQPVLMNRSIRCVRLDGSLSTTGRDRVLRVFRDNHGIAVLLATITCGGIGLNLTAASRAYIVEPQWNPMSESQALDRIHRLGQRNQVYTTRYLIRGTWEEVCNQILSGLGA
jgi:SWI/SNF-related matrix-associated actin-dependent regulator of chromatin subfamily A3